MSAPTAARHTYDVHGLGVAVDADTRAVGEAMDLRLRGFDGVIGQRADVRLEFVTGRRPGAVPTGGRRVYETQHGHLEYDAEDDILHGAFGGVHLHCDAAEGVARLRAAAFADRDLYVATHPLATISLMELLKRRGRHPLHAACLANDAGDGVLVAGPSGSGKSTLTVALALAGLHLLGDDTVFLDHDERTGRLRVLGFPDALGITPHTAQRFAALRSEADGPAPAGFPKRLVRPEALAGIRTAATCTPRVLVMPGVTPDRPSRLTPLDSKDALLRLVPDVLLTEQASTQAHLGAIAALLGQVGCHELESGRDLERGARLVADLL